MPRNHIYLRAFIVVAAASTATALFLHFDLWKFFTDRERLAVYIESFGGWSVAALIGIQILQVLAAPLPGEITGFAGGFVFGALKGTIWSTVGLTLGSWVAFVIGRWAGRPLVERFVDPKVLAHYDDVVTHGGKKVVFIFYLIPGFPKDMLCYVLGLSGLAYGDFLVLSTVGRFFGTVGLSVAGSFVRAEQYLEFVAISLVMGTVVIVSYFNRDKILHPIRWKRERTMRKKHGTDDREETTEVRPRKADDDKRENVDDGQKMEREVPEPDSWRIP